MAFRGRGRGRGRGGRGFFGGGGPQRPDEDFALFPKFEELPPIGDFTDEEKFCVQRKRQLEARYQNSPYFIKDKTKDHDTLAPDVERFSDTKKAKEAVGRVTLLDTLILSASNFPQELIEGRVRRGKRRSAHLQRKVNKDLRDMDLLLAKLKDDGDDDDDDEQEENKKKKKKDGDEEDDDEVDDAEEDEEEGIGADDYTENFGFDDDDDYLDDDNDGGDDEPTFD